MSKSMTDIYTYMGVLAIFAMFMAVIIFQGDELIARDASGKISLPNSSLIYIQEINANPNFNLSEYQATKDQTEDTIVFRSNSSEGSSKDFSIEYTESKERANEHVGLIKRVYTLPSTLVLLLKLPGASFQRYIDISFWILSILMGLAVYWMFRGVKN